MIRRPHSLTLTVTLLPYRPLFRSHRVGRRDVAVREDERRTNSSALACLPPLEGEGFNAPSVGFTLTREHRFSRRVTAFAACPPWKPPCARSSRSCCWPRCRPSPPIRSRRSPRPEEHTSELQS